MADQISPPIKLDFYGPAALLAVSQLVSLLVSKGTITAEEAARIWSTTAHGLEPQDHPGIKPLREMLEYLSRDTLRSLAPVSAEDGRMP